MSKQGDIRKFCLQGGGDSEEKDKEQAKREKRKLQQQSYNKKNRKRTIIETWVEESVDVTYHLKLIVNKLLNYMFCLF